MLDAVLALSRIADLARQASEQAANNARRTSFSNAVGSERDASPVLPVNGNGDTASALPVYGPYVPGREPALDPSDLAQQNLETKASELATAEEQLANLREEGAARSEIAAQQRVVANLKRDIGSVTEAAVRLRMNLESDPARKNQAGADEAARLAENAPAAARPYIIDAGQRTIIADTAPPPTSVTESCTAAPQYQDAPPSDAPPPLTVDNEVIRAVDPIIDGADGKSGREAEATVAAGNQVLWGEQAAQNSNVARKLEQDAKDAKAVFGENSPEYAAARARANAAWARAEAAAMQTEKHATQFAVYWLDPSYASATAAARSTINEAVTPLGLEWNASEARGSRAEMQRQLETVEGLATLANQIGNDRTLASHELDLWNDGRAELPELQRRVDSYDIPVVSELGNGPDPVARSLDRTDAERERDVATAQTNLHLGQSNVHATRADMLTTEYREKAAQLAIDETEPGTTDRKQAEQDLGDARSLKTTAEDNHELALLERNYAKTVETDAVLEQEGQVIRRRAIESQRERLPHLFQGEYTDGRGDAHVRLQEIDYEVRDGQLYQVNHYENGTMDYQLTYDPQEMSDRLPESQRQMYTDWANYYPRQQAADTNVIAAERALGERQRTDLDLEINRLQQNYDSAVEQHGDGTAQQPRSVLGPDNSPIELVSHSGSPQPHREVAQSKSALDAAYRESELLDLHLDYLDFVLSQPASAREDPEELEARFYEENEDRLRPIFNEYGREAIYREPQYATTGGELDELVGRSLGLGSSATSQAQEAISPIVEEIRDVTGKTDGETVEVRVVPFVYIDPALGKQDMALFEVEGKDGTYLVDDSGSRYEDIEDFQHNNYLSEDGRIFLPKNLDLTTDAGGNVKFEGMQAHVRSFTERVIDPVMTGTAAISTIASFTPLAPIAAPVAYGSGTYLGARSAMRLQDMSKHGRPLASKEGAMEAAMVATSALPIVSSTSRFGGLLKSGMTVTAATRSSLGAIRLKDFTLGPIHLRATPYAPYASQLMAGRGLLFTTARRLDYAAMAVGVPLLGQSAYDLAVHGKEMSGFEQLTAWMGLAGGIYGTGLGYRGWRSSRSGQVTQNAPASRVDVTPAAHWNRPHAGQAAQADGTIQLPLGTGQSLRARVLGRNRPAGPDDVFVPGVTPDRGQHFHLVRDETGVYILPWIRGASEDHPGPQPSTGPTADGTRIGQPEPVPDGTQVGQPATAAAAAGRDGGGAGDQGGSSTRPGFWDRMHDRVPDLRFGVQVRIRANTDLATAPLADAAGLPSDRAQIGHPTIASFGFAVSTKSRPGAVFKAGADGRAAFRQELGQQFVTSVRPREYQNITLAQLGLSPVSNQTVFQLKGKDLLEIGRQALFENAAAAPFVVMPRSAKLVGPAADGSGTVVELDYGLRLAGGEELAALPPDEKEFFGASADSKAGFVRLPGELAYNKIMEEFKFAARPRLLASNVPFVSKFVPRLGFERRPEVSFEEGATLPAGTLVARQFYDQHQMLLDRTSLRTQFVVREMADAHRLVADPRVSDIRALAAAGRINPSTVASYVPGIRSGLRLSAIPGKPSEARFTDLTGDERWVWDSAQTNLDIVFNDYYPLRGRSLPNPDRARSRLPDAANLGLPQAGYMPSDGNVYRSIFGRRAEFASAATRYTVSLSTPFWAPGVPGIKFLQSPFSASVELRMQWKRDAGATAPAVSRTDWTPRNFADESGLPVELTVPGWLATAITWSPDVPYVLVPKGGRESLGRFLTNDLEPMATPVQREAIDAFRQEILPGIKDQRFLPRSTLDSINGFLAGQARPASHLPPPGFTHLAAPEIQGPLESWYARNQAEPAPRRENPLPLWNAERARLANERPALTPE